MTDPAADELVTFIQHQVPGLPDGTYSLDLAQHVDDAKGNPISGDTLKRSYRFAVRGDRFRLRDPGSSIASTFPADNATGEYSTVLAHVVFTSTSLPWTRHPTTKAPAIPPPGKDTEVDVPTWLALLVLDDDDAAAFPGLALDPVTRVLGDLFPKAAYGDSTLGEGHSYFAGATSTKGLEIDEATGDPVQTIDVPLALFADVAPTLDDLLLSAHVRRLSVQNKSVALGETPAADPLGSFSIVVANRLPQSSRRSHAYLVSLERLERFLPATADGGTLTDGTLDLAGTLRLAVLHHWTFNSKGATAAFVDRLERLNERKDAADAPNTNLRVAVKEASPPVEAALAGGHVPLDHALRTGEKTVSWYRGPLSPVDHEPAAIELPISSPDRALILDPTTGMFDASLAAAWTIGRLAALQDKSFAGALYAWKKGLARAVVDDVERRIVAEALAGLLEEAAPRAASRQLLHDTMRVLGSEGAS